MIAEIIETAKQALTQRQQRDQADVAQLQADRVTLERLQALEQRVADGKEALSTFKAQFGEFCCDPVGLGAWFSAELSRVPGLGAEAWLGLLLQVAGHDAGKAHQAEIVAGCRRAWVEGPEAEIAAFKRENVGVMRRYGLDK